MRIARFLVLTFLMLVPPVSLAEAAEGTVDENVKAEVTILTYEALDRSMAQLAEQLACDVDGHELVLSTAPLPSREWKLLEALKRQLVSLKCANKDVTASCAETVTATMQPSQKDGGLGGLPPSPGSDGSIKSRGGSLIDAKTILDSLTGIVGAFHTSFAAKGQTVALDVDALASAAFSAFSRPRTPGCCCGPGATRVRYPAALPSKESELLELFRELESASQEASSCVTPRVTAVSAAVAALRKAAKDPVSAELPEDELRELADDASRVFRHHRVKDWIDSINAAAEGMPRRVRMKAVAATIEESTEAVGWAKLAKSLGLLKDAQSKSRAPFFDPKDADAPGRLTSLLLVEEYRRQLEGDALLLRLKPLFGGGENRATNNLFSGPRLSHAGAVVVSYMLLDNDGELLRAGTVRSYGRKKHKTFVSEFDSEVATSPVRSGDRYRRGPD